MKKKINSKFAELFKKYRLRSQFDTLTELSDELFQQGIVYDQSVFSRWQKGERIPTDRRIILLLINLFIERGGIIKLEEANEFLAVAGHGYLTRDESINLPKTLLHFVPFLVPREISSFTARQKYIDEISNSLLKGNIVLIQGVAGVGKTVLAIKIAYLLKDEYKDGVLWYRIDTMSSAQVLNSIAFSLNEDVSHIQDLSVKASIVRSFLANKNILLIFDNAEYNSDIHLLLPNTSSVSVIITSQFNNFFDSFSPTIVSLSIFDTKESLQLFQNILGLDYVKKYKKDLEKLSYFVGFLPLAIHILAKYMSQTTTTPQQVLNQLNNELITLDDFHYENKNLFASLSLCFSSLPSSLQELSVSLSIFAGTDFSSEGVAYIHSISHEKAVYYLDHLVSVSLLERSTGNRYRLHPLVKFFLRGKMNKNILYKKAALYFDKFLCDKRNKKDYYFAIRSEIENILDIFNYCYKLHYWREVVTLGDSLNFFIWSTEYWNILEIFTDKVYKSAQILHDDSSQVKCCTEGYSLFYYFIGEPRKAFNYANQGYKLAKKINNPYFIALSQISVAKTLHYKKQFEKSLSLLEIAILYFIKAKNIKELIHAQLILVETYLLMEEYDKAKNIILKTNINGKSVQDNKSYLYTYQHFF